MANIFESRTIILQLARSIGQLSEIFQWKGNHPQITETEILKSTDIISQIRNQLDIFESINHNIELIQQQEIIIHKYDPFHFSPEMTFEILRQEIQNWCDERNWEQYHTPRNIVMALVGEVGELSELFDKEFQPGVPELTDIQKNHLSEECSDVLHNLIRLCDRCRIDIVQAIKQKMIKNSKKYPAALVKGSSLKYDQY